MSNWRARVGFGPPSRGYRARIRPREQEGRMSAAELRERITKSMLDEINQVQYPSVTMLDRAEATLASADALADYAEALVKKIEATRFPSIALLNRLDAVLVRLERVEQQERNRRAA